VAALAQNHTTSMVAVVSIERGSIHHSHRRAHHAFGATPGSATQPDGG
jgi:hypothetical protein